MREGWLCVHAGVAPAWTAAQTLALAAEVETLLRGPDLGDFLPLMYGNQPHAVERRACRGLTAGAT